MTRQRAELKHSQAQLPKKQKNEGRAIIGCQRKEGVYVFAETGFVLRLPAKKGRCPKPSILCEIDIRDHVWTDCWILQIHWLSGLHIFLCSEFRLRLCV